MFLQRTCFARCLEATSLGVEDRGALDDNAPGAKTATASRKPHVGSEIAQEIGDPPRNQASIGKLLPQKKDDEA